MLFWPGRFAAQESAELNAKCLQLTDSLGNFLQMAKSSPTIRIPPRLRERINLEEKSLFKWPTLSD
jgi:hypothetical protein